MEKTERCDILNLCFNYGKLDLMTFDRSNVHLLGTC